MFGSNGGVRIVEAGSDAGRGAAHDDATADDGLAAIGAHAATVAGDVAGALRLAVDLGRTAPHPGGGRTGLLWDLLATVAAADLTVARTIEPHLDALAVLHEAGIGVRLDAVDADETSTWGVFAAEARGMRLTADARAGSWELTGTKPWCSLAAELTHALVTAHVGDGERRLFAVDLRSAGVVVQPDRWVARGLSAVRSGPVDFTRVAAEPVGAAGWYLERPGFSWGGIGVAAVWWGGGLGVARRTAEWAVEKAADARDGGTAVDSVAMMHLGVTDLQLETGRRALGHAAAEIDSARFAQVQGATEKEGDTTDRVAAAEREQREGVRLEARILTQRTRSTVARAVEEIIRTSKHAMGPAPLALEETHARRVADLELYLRQDHAEVDEAALGRALIAAGGPRW